MKLGALLTALLLVFSAVALTLPDYADAARMGGGRSFGSKPFMSKPAPAPVQRQATRGAGAAATAPKSGMFGGMGGLFGGLLAGTLLGSLLGGHGFAGGGFMDLIFIAILAFIGYKLYKRFRSGPAPAPANAGNATGNYADMNRNFNGMNRENTQATGWDALRGAMGGATPAAAQPNIDVPAGFDTEEFLRGAKMAYNRLQKSWDNRDLADISQFATPIIMENLKQQLAEDPNPSHTEIMLVNATLEGVEQDGDSQRAQVYFDVLMRENPNQSTPTSVREIWHFLRHGQNGTWKLDGIQQVD